MKTIKLLDVNFHYIPSAKTNILETFKKLGFDLPSEDKRYQEKWRRIRNSAAINEGVKK
jgi:hypothetical protein